MAIKRVTMQDIADACGLSRNTVSKVFNGRGAVPQETRKRILRKAEELGYGTPAETVSFFDNQPGGTIALLTSKLPRDAHFGTVLLPTFSDRVSRAGYTLRIYAISEDELRNKVLPPHFYAEQNAGILGIELFDQDYLAMICALNIPTVFIDSPRRAFSSLLTCDFVSMESIASIMTLVRRLVALGARHIGFVGDKEHCGSFYERWFGYCAGLRETGIPQNDEICILAPDDSPYHDTDWLIHQIRQMRFLPDAFMCANDYLAIHLMNALKKMGLSIPKDIMVTGFDGTVQSAMAEPPLTTVEIRGSEIGEMAANLLLNRIGNPSFPFSWTRLKSTPVWRNSTRAQD